MSMHRYTDDTERLAQSIMRVALDRMRMDVPLDGPESAESLGRRAGQTITPEGLRGDAAPRPWEGGPPPAAMAGRPPPLLAAGTRSVDHPRYLAFIPGAPTEASTLFDLLVAASALYGGSWMESSGA